jgi:hypothetical protein
MSYRSHLAKPRESADALIAYFRPGFDAPIAYMHLWHRNWFEKMLWEHQPGDGVG